MKSFVSNVRAGNAGLLLIFTILLLPLTVAAQTAAQEIDVVRSSAEFRDSRQFFRISEFFTGRENTGRDLIRRSQPDSREGYYFSIKLERYPYTKNVEEAVQLQVIMPGDIEPTLFSFPLGRGEKRNPLILIGLTGEDWPDPSARPLAWKISFLNADGEIVATEQSFLWSIEP